MVAANEHGGSIETPNGIFIMAQPTSLAHHTGRTACTRQRSTAHRARLCLSDDDDIVTIIRYRSSTMMDGIADMALRHGDRRARAYERSEPVIRCIQDAITAYRRDGGDRDGRPTISQLIAACSACGLTAAVAAP
jgi:hypothetical protein